MLQKTGLQAEISVNLVRSVQDLQACDALVIPGGGMSPIPCRPLLLLSPCLAESTTIALLAKLSGLLDPLREFLKTKPVWGSCAGAILMSRNVTNAKTGGQDLLGGLSVTTGRNGWGSQVGPNQVHCTTVIHDDSFRLNHLRSHSSSNRCPIRTDRFKECLFVPRYYPHLRSLKL